MVSGMGSWTWDENVRSWDENVRSFAVYEIQVRISRWSISRKVSSWCYRSREAIPACGTFGNCLKTKQRVAPSPVSEIGQTELFVEEWSSWSRVWEYWSCSHCWPCRMLGHSSKLQLRTADGNWSIPNALRLHCGCWTNRNVSEQMSVTGIV